MGVLNKEEMWELSDAMQSAEREDGEQADTERQCQFVYRRVGVSGYFDVDRKELQVTII